MLRVMLDRHPRIAVPPETRFVMRVYQRRNHFGDLAVRENRAKVARFIVDRKDTEKTLLALHKEFF